MKVYIDADACPVVAIVERVSKEFGIPVVLLCDTNHVMNSSYSEVIIVSAGPDAVDYALVNRISKGDIVVTQDYGVGAMVLSKGAYGIHQSGRWYTNENIDQLLLSRHVAKVARKSKKKSHIKGPKKRTKEDDIHFEEQFRKLILQVNKKKAL